MLKNLKEGDFVLLRFEVRENRIPAMHKWEGTVEEIVSFPIKVEGVYLAERKWARVNWGARKKDEQGRDKVCIWLERPEDLVLARRIPHKKRKVNN